MRAHRYPRAGTPARAAKLWPKSTAGRFVSSILFALFFAIGPASAGSFNISPTRIELQRGRAIDTLNLSNPGDEPMAFEAQVKRWTQNPDGTWQLDPSDDLVVHPLIVTVPAHGSAKVRVGALSPEVATEQAYRIELQQLPGDTKRKGAQIRLLTRLSIPVFMQAAQSESRAALESVRLQGCTVQFSLHNTGTAYMAPQPAALRVLDRAGKPLLEESITAGYVLAGSRLPMSHPLPPATCGQAMKIELGLLEPSATLSAPLASTPL